MLFEVTKNGYSLIGVTLDRPCSITTINVADANRMLNWAFSLVGNRGADRRPKDPEVGWYGFAFRCMQPGTSNVAIQQALMACCDEGAVPRVGDG